MTEDQQEIGRLMALLETAEEVTTPEGIDIWNVGRLDADLEEIEEDAWSVRRVEPKKEGEDDLMRLKELVDGQWEPHRILGSVAPYATFAEAWAALKRWRESEGD